MYSQPANGDMRCRDGMPVGNCLSFGNYRESIGQAFEMESRGGAFYRRRRGGQDAKQADAKSVETDIGIKCRKRNTNHNLT